MQEAKKLELKNIDVTSVFRFCGGIFLIIGLVIGLFGRLLGIDVMTTGIIRIFPFIAKLSPGIIAGIVFGFIYGLSGGAVFSIFALLYNFFASLLGGLKFSAKE